MSKNTTFPLLLTAFVVFSIFYYYIEYTSGILLSEFRFAYVWCSADGERRVSKRLQVDDYTYYLIFFKRISYITSMFNMAEYLCS